MLRLLDASLTSASKRVSVTAMHFPLVSLSQQGYGAAQVEEFNFELFVPTVALKHDERKVVLPARRKAVLPGLGIGRIVTRIAKPL